MRIENLCKCIIYWKRSKFCVDNGDAFRLIVLEVRASLLNLRYRHFELKHDWISELLIILLKYVNGLE